MPSPWSKVNATRRVVPSSPSASASSSVKKAAHQNLKSPKASSSPKARSTCSLSSNNSGIPSTSLQPQKPLSKKNASLLFYEPSEELLATRQMLLKSKTKASNRKKTGGGAGTRNLMAAAASTTPRTSLKTSTRRSFSIESSSSSSSHHHYDLIPNAASSMSDDNDDHQKDDDSSSPASTTTASTATDEEAAGTTAASAPLESSSRAKSPKNVASFLEKSLRRLDEIIKSTSKEERNTKEVNNNKVPRGKNGKKLPETGFYSNNHVMVNRERAIVGANMLHRSRHLDSLALSHVVDLADDCQVVHSVETLPELRRLLQAQAVGENVQRGTSIQAMHDAAMMKSRYSNSSNNSRSRRNQKHNILRQAYTEFGMATCVGKKDGMLYMVQLFRGPTFDQQRRHDESDHDEEFNI